MNATMTKKQEIEQERERAREDLRALMAGDESPVIGTILRHCSASGMSRDISVYYKETNITYLAAIAMGDKVKNSKGFNAIRVTGCGMDMGFHLVYNLSITLFSPDKYDHESAYRLKQRWL
jgi:hypothetical protein